jgi:hypothetical protein
MDSTIDLGDNYRYFQEKTHPSIIYQTDPNANGSGPFVVPPVITNYSYNSRYIIAKSIDQEHEAGNDKSVLKYWIIDKTVDYNKQETFMDSITFYKNLVERNIGLKFD